MKYIKFIIGFLLIVLVCSMALGLFTMPKVKDIDSQQFSAERVAKDIKVISQEHHSVIDFYPRERVRQYLFDRLEEMGASAQIIRYDSIEYRHGGIVDLANVYATIEPESQPASSYILLVAHLDSRYPQVVIKDTVQSFGAADDGYGLGVVLELVNQAVKYQQEWKQGVRVLFTDAEENGLDGMTYADSLSKEIFDNVGLVINIDARGVKGPALLFETSIGNEKVISLYKKSAKFHYSYSVTSFVYNFIPNLTDFMIVKNSIPGLNFSVIDNLNYYHTDKDCFDNINLKSIQHYGAQLEPIVKEYLTNGCYSDSDYLKSDKDSVFFSVPGFNLFRFTKGQYLLFNFIVLVLFCIAFAFNYITSNAKIKQTLKYSLILLLASLFFLAIGEVIGYLSALITGVKFSLTNTKYVTGEYTISIVFLLFMILATSCFIVKRKRVSKEFIKEIVFASMFVLLLLSVILLFTIGENFFFLVPVAICSIAMICYPLTVKIIFSLAASVFTALLMVSFLSNILIALTIGSLGIVAFIGFFSIVLIVALFCSFMEKRSR